MSKKLSRYLLLAGMILGLAMPTLAADNVSGSVTTTLEGVIKPTQLKVTVPTDIPFDISGGINVAGSRDVTGQITNRPETLQIINESIIPVYVYITNVKVSDGLTLVRSEDGLSNDRSLMLGFREKNTVHNFKLPSDWLQEGAAETPYFLNENGGRISAGIQTDSGTQPGVMDLEIYGQLGEGWTASETFTVTPTYVVSVRRPE